MKEPPAELCIDLATDVLFDFDRADLLPKAQATLSQAAGIIRDKAKGSAAFLCSVPQSSGPVSLFCLSVSLESASGLSLSLRRIRDAYSRYPSSETWPKNGPTTPNTEECIRQENLRPQRNLGEFRR